MPCNSNDIKTVLSLDPREAIEIKGGTKINVALEKTTTKDIYTISYKEYTPPTISVSHTGPGNLIAKVGTTVTTATFAGSILAGSEDIVERTMIPDKGLNLTLPISYTEGNIIGTTPGLWPQFSGTPTIITVKDSIGTTISKQVGVDFRHLFYMGYSTLDNLDEANIKSLITQDLLTSILSKYSSFTYNYSLLPVYIYWVFPSDTVGFTSAAEGPLPVPLKLDIPSITITDSGITKQYRVIRTAVKTSFVSSTITLH